MKAYFRRLISEDFADVQNFEVQIDNTAPNSRKEVIIMLLSIQTHR